MLGITALLVTPLLTPLLFPGTVTERRYFSSEVTSNVTALLFCSNGGKVTHTRYSLQTINEQTKAICAMKMIREPLCVVLIVFAWCEVWAFFSF